MEYKVIWTEPALTDLNNIYAYIANENPDAAQKVGENILNHVDVLEQFPFIGPAYPRDSSGRVREIVCGKYRIFYRVDEEKMSVEILTVWHGSRGTPRI